MKTYTLIIFLTFNLAHAGFDECLRDAKTHGDHASPVSPSSECVGIIKSHSEKIEFKTRDEKYHLYGLGHMMYVESQGKRDLLSGDQTELQDILKIDVNQEKNRLLILQKESVSTFNLDFIGNVSPLSHFKSSILKNASRIKLLENQDMIAIFSDSSVRIINSNADSRYAIEKSKPKLLYEINGKNSLLNKPTDLVIDSSRKKIYVLDSNRVLVFSINVKKGMAPLNFFYSAEARSLLIKNDQIHYVNLAGQEFLLSY